MTWFLPEYPGVQLGQSEVDYPKRTQRDLPEHTMVVTAKVYRTGELTVIGSQYHGGTFGYAPELLAAGSLPRYSAARLSWALLYGASELHRVRLQA